MILRSLQNSVLEIDCIVHTIASVTSEEDVCLMCY